MRIAYAMCSPSLRRDSWRSRCAASASAPNHGIAEIGHDLRTAIDTLAAVGAIDAASADRARTAALGELPRTMAPVQQQA